MKMSIFVSPLIHGYATGSIGFYIVRWRDRLRGEYL